MSFMPGGNKAAISTSTREVMGTGRPFGKGKKGKKKGKRGRPVTVQEPPPMLMGRMK